MRINILCAAVASLLLVACGSEGLGPNPGTSSVVASLPTTVEGDLVIDVGEGDVDEGENAEFNFGTLTVGGEEIDVQVSGSTLQAGGFSGETSGKVRATISSKTDEYGPTTYTVTSLQRL